MHGHKVTFRHDREAAEIELFIPGLTAEKAIKEAKAKLVYLVNYDKRWELKEIVPGYMSV